MNDIFKIFKKRAAAGKSTNIKDVIKDLSENEKDEIGKFDRGNKSYLSISKSGRLKSKKASAQSANAHRVLNEDLFKGPLIVNNNNANNNSNGSNQPSNTNKPTILGSLASSANSSFRSSLEDVDDMASSASSTSSSSSSNGMNIDYYKCNNASATIWQNKF